MANVWKVGVAIVADSGGIDAALGKLGLKMIGLQGQADQLGARFGRMSTMLLGVGTAMVASGAGLLGTYYKIAQAGDKIVQQQAQMRIAGIDEGTIKSVTDLAEKLASIIPNSTDAGNMETWNKLRPTLGDQESAAALPGTQTIMSGLKVKYPDIASQAENMFKALDLFGAGMDKTTHQFDANTWNTSLNTMARLMATTHGMINPSMMFQIAKGGGVMAQGADFTSFLEQMAAVFMEQGSRAGTGMNTLMGQFIGGKVTLRTSKALEKYGLVNPRGIEKDHGVYMIKNPEDNIVGGTDIIKKGIGYWFSNDVLPALRKHGVNTNDTGQVIQALTQIIGDQRAARLLYTMGTPAGQQQTARDAGQLDQAVKNGADWSAMSQGTLLGATQSLTAAFTSLFQTLGEKGGATSNAIALINQFSDAVRKLNGEVAANPKLAGQIMDGLVGVSAALISLGSAAVIASITRFVGASRMVGGIGGGLALGGMVTGNQTMEDSGIGLQLGGVLGGMAGARGRIIGAAIGAGIGAVFANREWVEKEFSGVGSAIAQSFEHAWVMAAPRLASDLIVVSQWVHAAEAAAMALVAGIEHGIAGAIHNGVTGLANQGMTPQSESYHLPPAQHAPIQVISYTTLDGKVIAKTVSAHQARYLVAPQSGPSGFNPAAGLPSPGQAYNT